jgi:hypothetical protein
LAERAPIASTLCPPSPGDRFASLRRAAPATPGALSSTNSIENSVSRRLVMITQRQSRRGTLSPAASSSACSARLIQLRFGVTEHPRPACRALPAYPFTPFLDVAEVLPAHPEPFRKRFERELLALADGLQQLADGERPSRQALHELSRLFACLLGPRRLLSSSRVAEPTCIVECRCQLLRACNRSRLRSVLLPGFHRRSCIRPGRAWGIGS